MADILSSLAGSGKPRFNARPVVMGTNGMVTSGHYLASRIGLHILEEGGNAVDAGVAMGFALAVLEPYIYGIGGEVPILIYLAREGKVFALSGQGPAPKAATIEWFRKRGIDTVPGEGLLAAAVPDAVSTWIAALSSFGTMTLSRVLEPSVELAEKGFPLYDRLRASLEVMAPRWREEWPSSARTYLPEDRIPNEGEVYAQADLARMFRALLDGEARGRRGGREEGLRSAREVFYKGPIAEKIASFVSGNEFQDVTGRKNRGLLTAGDLASYSTRIEEPVSTEYRGYEVFKCGPWCQGPVFCQQLNILEGYDLPAMGHNSPRYVHLLAEAAKLAFADREKYYGDPDFVKVPLHRLLSKDYAAERRRLIDPARASMELRPGDCPPETPIFREDPSGTFKGDTTHLDAVDRWGNMMAATPSGGWFASSPVVEGLGFPLGSRMQMFYLDPWHANALAPGKRPRTTLTPSLVLRDQKPFMVFGTPGGDQQDQWTLQFFLNCVEFGMNMQEAADAPTFHSSHFPASFYPHSAEPGVLNVEEDVPPELLDALRDLGHEVKADRRWSHGRVVGIRYEAESGVMHGVSTARLETGYAMGW